MRRCEPRGAFAEGVIVDRDPGDENDALACVYCESMRAKPRKYDGYTLHNQCDDCFDNREPGDSYYEDSGSVRHELQEASGVWRR